MDQRFTNLKLQLKLTGAELLIREEIILNSRIQIKERPYMAMLVYLSNELRMTIAKKSIEQKDDNTLTLNAATAACLFLHLRHCNVREEFDYAMSVVRDVLYKIDSHYSFHQEKLPFLT